MHTRRRAASVRRMSESSGRRWLWSARPRTSAEPGSTPGAAQSSSQLMSLGVTDTMPRAASCPPRRPACLREVGGHHRGVPPRPAALTAPGPAAHVEHHRLARPDARQVQGTAPRRVRRVSSRTWHARLSQCVASSAARRAFCSSFHSSFQSWVSEQRLEGGCGLVGVGAVGRAPPADGALPAFDHRERLWDRDGTSASVYHRPLAKAALRYTKRAGRLSSKLSRIEEYPSHARRTLYHTLTPSAP